jgi:predicted nucleic acid-binding protein
VADEPVKPYLKPYLDSSVWIAAFTGQALEGHNGRPRCEIALHILEESEKGKYLIYISALTLAEVHKVKGNSLPPLTTEEDERILAYFERDNIRVVEVDRTIGEQANLFCRQFGIKPNDAIHLACALSAKCDVLLFWDRAVTDRAKQHPGIRVEEPRITSAKQLTLIPAQVVTTPPEPPAPVHAPDATPTPPPAPPPSAARPDVNQNVSRIFGEMIERSEDPPNRGSLKPVNPEPEE